MPGVTMTAQPDPAQSSSRFDTLVWAASARLAEMTGVDEATAWNILYPPNGVLGAIFTDCPLCAGKGCFDCTDGKVTGP